MFKLTKGAQHNICIFNRVLELKTLEQIKQVFDALTMDRKKYPNDARSILQCLGKLGSIHADAIGGF